MNTKSQLNLGLFSTALFPELTRGSLQGGDGSERMVSDSYVSQPILQIDCFSDQIHGFLSLLVCVLLRVVA